MSRSLFPNSLDAFTEKQFREDILPDHINLIQDAIAKVQGEVLRLDGVVRSQQAIDLEALTGGETEFTLADAKMHAETPHGVTLSSLIKQTLYGAGLSAEGLFNRIMEDVATNRNLLVSPEDLKVYQEGGDWKVSWTRSLKVILRNKNNISLLSVRPATFTMVSGDVLAVRVSRDVTNGTSLDAFKTKANELDFDPNANEVWVIGYFAGDQLVMKNGFPSQIRDHHVAADARIHASKIYKPYVSHLTAEIGDTDLNTAIDLIFKKVTEVDERLLEGIMYRSGGKFLGAVEFLDEGVTITKGEDDNGEIIFGNRSNSGTSRIKDTTDKGLEMTSSKKISLDAAEGVWVNGQSLKAPGAYDITLSDGTPLAGGAERTISVAYSDHGIPTFGSATPRVAVTDITASGGGYFLARVKDSTATGFTLVLKNPLGTNQALNNKFQLMILS